MESREKDTWSDNTFTTSLTPHASKANSPDVVVVQKDLVDEIKESPSGSSQETWRKQLDSRLLMGQDVFTLLQVYNAILGDVTTVSVPLKHQPPQNQFPSVNASLHGVFRQRTDQNLVFILNVCEL